MTQRVIQPIRRLSPAKLSVLGFVVLTLATTVFLLAMGQGFAMPGSPTDQSKVPHYFGPWPNWALSPLTAPDATVTITGDGTGATATATVGGNGAVTDVVVTDPGSGYTTATVDFTGAGSGATANATVVSSGVVTAVNVDAGGAGYSSPTVSFSGGGNVGTVTQVGNPLIPRTFASDFATPPGTLAPVFVVVPASMPATGTVTSIRYFNQATAGSSPTFSAGNLFHAYVLHPTGIAGEYAVLWDSGELTVPLTADPVGVVESIPVPDVAVTTGDAIAFYGEGIPLDDLGTGADTLSYPAVTAPVQGGTITLGGVDFPIFSQTRTYSFGATVLDTTSVVPVTQATATAFGGIDALTLGAPGSGYTFPTVDFDAPDAPDGVQAKAHADFDPGTGAITALVIDDPGSGYSSAPGVVIRDGTLADPIVDGGAGATATATLTIQSVSLDTFGGAYVSAPTVSFGDATGTGSGAAATAATDAGGVTAVALTAAGTGYVTPGGIKKFQDDLPGLCDPASVAGCPSDPAVKFIPLAVPQPKLYDGINADQYEIALVQFRTTFSSDLPPTLVRGYVQLETPANAAISQHYPLTNANLDPAQPDTPILIGGEQAYAVTSPQWLGPVIGATKNKPVRIVFHNLLPTGSEGDLFLPADSTLMGSGMGPMDMMDPVDQKSVLDEVRNPVCSEYPKSPACFKDNRATLHLHGGITPWISDGTAHQWITPAGENTDWPQGVSVKAVPDMTDVDTGDRDGIETFYYTNQQSARLMFYHDHAWGITRLNVYAGEAAGYLISDDTEKALIGSGTIPGPADTIPLIVQDKTFVPDAAQLAAQDPTWDSQRWGGKGALWYHHVYMPAQNPGDPGGMSAYGRWMYGPWFWPPAADAKYGPIPNPYYNMDPATDFTTELATPCNLDDPSTWQYQTDPFCEPELIPGTPNISVGMEQFNDTPIVNGVAYPKLSLDPKTYRLRLLNAANDRFFNFQWYVADPRTGTLSEVALNPGELAAAQTDPVVSPSAVQSVTVNGQPVDLAGPDWIQIGSEGGFLPAPAVIDGQQVTTWITDPTRFDVGNVDLHSLLLAPAERADVIVDFSKYAGKTLILYNDAPAAFPARVPSYDYYTGGPDLSPNGAPTILPGYGPNTRTIMQVTIGGGTPAPAFNLTKLRSAFSHKANGSGVFESGQHPIIVGQAAYNSAYGTSFAASSNCNAPGSTQRRCDGFVRVSDTTEFGFNTLKSPGTKTTMPLQPKAIHDEMNATTFDEFGRMQANLGIEAQPPTPGLQNVTLYPFVNPATELIDGTDLPRANVTYDVNGDPVSDVKILPLSSAADGSQIWRITHNGVDTHPIHFHLYDVQVLNRVTWDNIIIPTEASELGWKDTVRMSPLEDTIVALRPVVPEVPWELPNAIRPLNPMMPIGSQAMFNNIDPQGNPTTPVTNQLVNFGWEYVYHCHILSHEEMDMMRPVALALPPLKPDGLAFSFTGNGANRRIVVSWNDNSINETSFLVQRSTDGATWIDAGTVAAPLDQPNVHEVRTFTDPTADPDAAYLYRIVANNTVGYGAEFPAMTVKAMSATQGVNPPAAPTGLTGILESGPQVALSWTDNAINEANFIVERAVNGGAFAQIGTAPARPNPGDVTFVDTTVAADTTYDYRVAAVNVAGTSAYSNTFTVVVPPLPGMPTLTSLTAVRSGNNKRGQNNERVTAVWTDVTNETAYTIQWSTDSSFATVAGSDTAPADATTLTTGVIVRQDWWFRIGATNVVGTVWSAPVSVAAAP